MKRLLAGLALLTLLASLAQAGVEECDAASNRGDFPAAHSECLPLAQAGDTQAQNNPGFMYYEGRGVAQDYGEALK
jgi:TPR repeat protein